MHIKGLKLEPILLHQSDCTVQNGRVGPKTDDSEVEDVFTLEISASRTSLDVSTPIQIQINVISQPMPNNTFGNTEAISNGEAILIEGLVMARSMARRAGWTCQEEDESEMIEWVRDQMDIQWLSETIADTDVLFPICSTVEGIHRFRRARTFSNGSIRIRTPNLSPYASRTHSYQNKRNEDQRLGLQCDTTISQLHKFSTNIKEHKAIQSEEAGDLPHVNDTNGENDKGLSPRHVEENGASKVSIAAVESNTVKRPLKTSFGGFSSLNESRSQTLALAEMTEDHLGLALSAPSPPARSSSSGSSNNSAAQEKSTGTFGDGISSSDLGAIETTKPSLPPERSLSRFSIKSYQLERNNHGLGDEWALGDVDQFLGSTSTKIDLSTPPLIAERRPSGGISPLSPSPSKFQDIDFLQDLTGRVSPKTHDNVSLQNGSGAVLLESAAVSPNEKPHIENIRRKSFGVFGPRSNSGLSQPNDLGSSGSSDSNRDRKSPAQLLEEPLEFVPDFLGNSFGSPKTSAPATFTDVPDFLGASFRTPKSSPSSTAAKHVPDFLGNTFGSPPKRAFVKLSDTDPSLERNYSSPGAIGSTKVVHFAEVDAADKLRRTDSEPITHVHESGSNGTARRNSGSNEGGDEDSEMLRKSMLNDNSNLLVSPQTSKSKAHTRRSWGQGIGGHDIQGIQGLE
ncbi:hypothetical protein FBU30_000503 [Linnemannia zychae]|nr:hypothetical protein FBU30_000503 [Linnemannia zychae]